MDRENTEIEKIRATIHYRIAELLVSSRRSPIKDGLLLPLRLLRLWRHHKRQKQKAPISARSLLTAGFDQRYRNSAVYVNKHREIHRALMLRPLPPFSRKLKLDIRAGALLDEELFACIELDLHLTQVPENGWRSYLEQVRPQLIIINSAWKLAQGGGLAFVDETSWIVAFLRHCREKGVPTLCWYTDSDANTDAFQLVFENVDHIFAGDRDSFAKLSQTYPGTVRQILPPAVQPALHNAVHFEPFDRGRLTYLFDGWADLIEYEKELSKAFLGIKDEGLHIVDSRNVMIADRLNYLPAWRENIIGGVDYHRLLSAFKCYPVCLFPRHSLTTGQSRSRRIMEAMACGARAVASEASISALPPDVIEAAGPVLKVVPDDGFSQAAKQLYSAELDRASHRLRRYIYLHHTYAHRLEVMFRHAKVKAADTEAFFRPKVSVITPTKRPEVLASRIENYIDQSYPNREWIIIVNTLDEEVNRLRDALESRTDVRIEVVHQEQSLSSCLNSAIRLAEGALWFKMDDDDFYGSNYLLDMVLLWRQTGADLFGKPLSYIYYEKENTLYCRNFVTYADTVVAAPSPILHGATLAGTVTVARSFPFSHKLSGGEDYILFEDAYISGLLMIYADPYNFTCFRSSREGFHTWRPDPDNFFKHNKAICSGKGETYVNI